jgi:hypothetical protein
LPKIRLIADRQRYLPDGDVYPALLRFDQEKTGIS